MAQYDKLNLNFYLKKEQYKCISKIPPFIKAAVVKALFNGFVLYILCKTNSSLTPKVN